MDAAAEWTQLLFVAVLASRAEWESGGLLRLWLCGGASGDGTETTNLADKEVACGTEAFHVYPLCCIPYLAWWDYCASVPLSMMGISPGMMSLRGIGGVWKGSVLVWKFVRMDRSERVRSGEPALC